jgi:hypothetical protein
MIDVPSLKQQGKPTKLRPGDVLRVSLRGAVSVDRGHDTLTLHDRHAVTDRLPCGAIFSLDGAANLAKLIALAGGFTCEWLPCRTDDSAFRLTDPSYEPPLVAEDLMVIYRQQGQVYFLRGTTRLKLEAASRFPRNHQMTESFLLASSLSAEHATNTARLIAMARQLGLRRLLQDPVCCHFALFDPRDHRRN